MSFCCEGVKAKTRQNFDNTQHSSSTKQNKSKPNKRPITEVTAKKKSVKIIERQSSMVWTRYRLKAHVKRCRSKCRLQGHAVISPKHCRVKSELESSVEPHSVAGSYMTEPLASVEQCMASAEDADFNAPDTVVSDTPTTVEELVSSESAADCIVEPVTSDSSTTTVEELDLNTAEVDCKAAVPAESLNSAVAANENVDSPVTADDTGSEQPITAERLTHSPIPVDDIDAQSAEETSSLSQQAIEATTYEPDSESRDALSIATVVLSSSPADTMVCLSDVFLCFLLNIKLVIIVSCLDSAPSSGEGGFK